MSKGLGSITRKQPCPISATILSFNWTTKEKDGKHVRIFVCLDSNTAHPEYMSKAFPLERTRSVRVFVVITFATNNRFGTAGLGEGV